MTSHFSGLGRRKSSTISRTSSPITVALERQAPSWPGNTGRRGGTSDVLEALLWPLRTGPRPGGGSGAALSIWGRRGRVESGVSFRQRQREAQRIHIAVTADGRADEVPAHRGGLAPPGSGQDEEQDADRGVGVALFRRRRRRPLAARRSEPSPGSERTHSRSCASSPRAWARRPCPMESRSTRSGTAARIAPSATRLRLDRSARSPAQLVLLPPGHDLGGSRRPALPNHGARRTFHRPLVSTAC